MKGRGFSPADLWTKKNRALAPEGDVRPRREPARNNQQTYFVTFQTAQRTPFFRNETWAVFFLNIVQRYRNEFQLHDFVVMHDHIHLLITPVGALERGPGLLKGGFSFLVKRELAWKGDIWQEGYSDHRIPDFEDWQHDLAYIQKNVDSLRVENYRFCGRNAGLPLDAIPQWLKPLNKRSLDGGAEAPPLQSDIAEETPSADHPVASAAAQGFETNKQSGAEVPESILMDWK
ncbi:MAG TPA: transposase [Acidobacteriaceae bacterium]